MNQITIYQILDILEISHNHFEDINGKQYEIAKNNLDKLKELASRKRKILALRYHPDVGGSEEKMKEVNIAYDIISKLELIRPPQVVRFSFHYSSSSYSTYSTSSSYTYWE